MITPRPYQQEVIDRLKDSYRAKKKHPVIVMPTGAGKACVLGFVVENAAKKGNETLVIAHRQELVFQLSLTLCNFGIEHQIIASNSTISAIKFDQYKSFGRIFYNPMAKVAVCSVQTLCKRLDKINLNPRLIITDECFPAGTLIDSKPIEKLKVGDMVFSLNHLNGNIERKRITNLFKSKPKELVIVKMTNGDTITCTAGHPFFVPNYGYYHAKQLSKNMPVLYMPQNSGAINQLSERQIQENWEGLLQHGMLDGLSKKDFIRNNGENESKIRIKSNESKKPHVQSRMEREGSRNTKKNWSQATEAWREWTGYDSNTTHVESRVGESRVNCERRVHSKNTRIQTPIQDTVPLQDRFSDRIGNDSHRDRWLQPSITSKTGTGCEKNESFRIARVESVEVQKSGDFGFSRELLPDGYVYNIEVEDNNNYFANGYMVHNCHHVVKGNQWGAAYDHFPNALGLGLTASPQRTDGTGLGLGFGGYNDDIIIGPQMSWLIEQGFLAPYKVFTTGTQMDVSSVKKKRNGEFDEKSLQQVTDKPSITGDAIAHYKKLCPHLSGVAYCVSIEHSKHVAELFTANNIPAAHIDGTMKDTERRQIFKDYADGKIKIITNQNIISEGTDLESLTQIKGVTLDVCIDLAPTSSLIVAMQRWGRVLRNKANKTAYIIDHAGNCLRHGLPDMEREWSLEGEVKTINNSGEKSIGIRTCKQCFHIHLPEPTCPSCGFVYPIQQRTVEEKDGELIELSKEDKELIKKQAMWQRKREQANCETLQDLLELGRQRGYKGDGWARQLWAARRAKQEANA